MGRTPNLSSDRRSADGAAAGIRVTEAGGVAADHETVRPGCSTTGISRPNLVAGKKTDITISVTIGIPKWEIYLNQAQRRRMALRQDGDKDEWMNAPQTPASAQRVEYSRAATRLRYYH